MIDLMPPGVRLDVTPTRAESVATYVRLEYGDRDADWIADGRGATRGIPEATSTRRTAPRRTAGVLASLTSWFQPARRQADHATETTPCVDGADAPSLVR